MFERVYSLCHIRTEKASAQSDYCLLTYSVVLNTSVSRQQAALNHGTSQFACNTTTMFSLSSFR